MGLLLKQRLAAFIDRHSAVVVELRGEGLMLGLRCKLANTDVSSMFFAQKLLTVSAGDNVIRLLPPLIVGDLEIDEACAKIDTACGRLNATLAA